MSHRLLPNPRRVVARPFLFSKSRVRHAMDRILAIPEQDVPAAVEEMVADFSGRHRDFERILEENFERAAIHLEDGEQLSRARRLLIGGYFTHEYSIEAAALFSPSMVSAPDQSGTGPGEQRFVMSVRGVAEGHLSSIGFRTGTIGPRGGVRFDPVGPYAVTGRRKPPLCDRGCVWRPGLR